MLFVVFVAAFYMAISAVTVLTVWFLVVRYGPVDDLDPSSWIVRLLSKPSPTSDPTSPGADDIADWTPIIARHHRRLSAAGRLGVRTYQYVTTLNAKAEAVSGREVQESPVSFQWRGAKLLQPTPKGTAFLGAFQTTGKRWLAGKSAEPKKPVPQWAGEVDLIARQGPSEPEAYN